MQFESTPTPLRRVAPTAVRYLLVLVLVAAALGWGNPALGQGIVFDDSYSDLILMGNSSFYEIGIRKSDGSIAFITDRSTGQQVSLGSRGQCLWVAEFFDRTTQSPSHVGGCHWSAQNGFSYRWSQTDQTLSLIYHPGPENRVRAQVTIRVSEEPWFDLRMGLQNDSEHVLDNVLFPADLVFEETGLQEVLLPVLPGVVLKPGFFEQNRGYTAKYPGFPGVFADYVSLSSTRGQIAIYSLYGGDPLRPLDLGFIHDDIYVSDSTFYRHAFAVQLAAGKAWSSPTVRVRVSQPALDTIRAYRKDNGLDQFLSLAEKLGPRFAQLIRSPLLKADTVQLNTPFSDYADLLSTVPAPGLLHPVAFHSPGFDQNYPDFLPPDPNWGTTAELAAVFTYAQERGFLVMPYINPTWWHAESPTLQDLPPGTALTDLTALDGQGMPVYECFAMLCGYVMSPHVPFVRQRLDELMTSMTVDVPSDLLLEDQIGARRWLFDHNAAAPGPLSYIEGWLEHARTYQDLLLMTELGFDRLAETMVGFNGSVLLSQLQGATDSWWGDDNWRPYPMAPLMVRDKVLFYQHDLAPQTFTFKKETLTWNLAFGFMLSHNLFQEGPFGGGLDTDWLRLVSLFQRIVLARYADETLTGFRDLDAHVTETSFETFTAVANWDGASSFAAGGNTLPPWGVQVRSTTGDMTAGVFTGYNGMPLSPGDHALIEVRGCDEITVYQPVGPDTPLTLELLPGWQPSDSIVVSAWTADGVFLADVTSAAVGREVTFDYQQEIDGESVGAYTVTASPVSSIFCKEHESRDPPRR